MTQLYHISVLVYSVHKLSSQIKSAAGIIDTSDFGFEQQEFFVVLQSKFMREMMLR